MLRFFIKQDHFTPERDTIETKLHEMQYSLSLFSWASVLWVLLVILSEDSLCWGCKVEERGALLELKVSIEEWIEFPHLPSWRNESDCCHWERVGCDNTTNRVVELLLSGISSVDDPEYIWPVNFSLFNSFKQLRRLELSSNQITTTLEPEGFLGNLSSLQILDLSYNLFEGALPFHVFGRLQKLRKLNLQGNWFNGSLPSSHGVPPSLQWLDLSKNQFEGKIPPSFFTILTSLQYLDLSSNMLSEIPSSLFTNLTSLEYLDLSSNKLSGHFSFLAFSNHSNLSAVILSPNNGLVVETEFRHSAPLFQLKYLMLSGCNLNRNALSTSFLSSQHALEAIDLSHNKLLGNFPIWLLENNTKLSYINLRNNSLSGEIHLSLDPIASIRAIDASMNNMNRKIPSNIGTIFPHIFFLNLSTNDLSGNIPSSIGSISGLKVLDLSNNHFSGKIPYQLTTGCLKLEILKLSNNNLHGQMLPRNPNLSHLSHLFMGNNKFSGTIPVNLFNSPNLTTLDIQNNQLSGSLPESIGNLSGLYSLLAQGNHLEGPIPIQLCNLKWLDMLDLSHNRFSGQLPSCSSSLPLRYINLNGNDLTGSISSIPFNASNLVVLDIGINHFSGNLPMWLGDQTTISILVLEGNNFHGYIPVQLCNIYNLLILDLSDNNFSGMIPRCFDNTMFGKAVSGPFDPSSWVLGTSWSLWSLPISVNKKFVIWSVMEYEFPDIEFVTRGSLRQHGKRQWYLMIRMDLSGNKLTGHIPLEIGNLSSIQVLDMSNNHLTGSIPGSLSNLNRIESLDLSHNELSGSIPQQLTQLRSLVAFSVARNNLSGRIPDFKAPYMVFNASSYEGNKGLCGPPLRKRCNSS